MYCENVREYKLYLIALLALALRLALFYQTYRAPSRFFYPDSYGYDRAALNILKYHTLSVSQKLPPAPDALRTPVYPLFLSALYCVFGHSPAIAIFFQIMVSTITVFLIYKTAVVLFEHRTMGLIAALAYALEPASVIYANYLLTETVFTFLVVLVFYLLSKFIKGKDARYLFYAFSCMAAVTLTRPIFTFFPVIVFFVLRKNSKPLWNAGLLYILIIGLWVARNALVVKEATMAAVIDQMPLAQAVNFESARSGMSLSETKTKLMSGIAVQNTTIRNSILNARAKGYIKMHWGSFLFYSLKSTIDPLLPRAGPLFSLTRGRDPGIGFKNVFKGMSDATPLPVFVYLLYCLIFLWIVYFFAVRGVILLIKQKNAIATLMSVFVLYYLALEILSYEERHRVPVVPFIALCAAYGITSLKRCPLSKT